MNIRSYFLFSGAALCLINPAYASEISLSDTENQSNSARDDIIVSGSYVVRDQIDTATGLGLTVSETPQSVSILTSQRIIDQNLTTISQIVNNAVGVSGNELDDVRNSFYARGFEITNYQVDGVPVAWLFAGQAGETIADVSIYERVEIVRGATGLLTGAGEPSASVNMVRKHATAEDWGGYVNASIGSWNTWRVSGDVGGALTSDGRIRARFVGRYEEGESFVDLYSNQKFVLYGVIDADVTDNILVRVGISHQEGKPNAPSWGALPSFYSDGDFAIWNRSKTTAADWTFWNTLNQNIFAHIEHDIGGGWSIQANYNRVKNSQAAELLYLSGLVDTITGNIESSYAYKVQGTYIQDSFDAQLKGRVTLFGRDHDVVLGGMSSIQRRQDTTFAALNTAPSPNYINWDGAAYPRPDFSSVGTLSVDERVKQQGLYGVARLNISDRLKIIGGGRLASWELSGINYSEFPRTYGNDNIFIPYVGALYDLTPNHRLYASFTRIFQPQDARDQNLELLAPMQGSSYEIGLKSAFFHEALQTTLSLFQIEQDNVAQLDTVVTPPGGLPQQTYIAAKGVTSKGFELEATGHITPEWNINFGYSQFTIRNADGLDVNTDQPRKLLKLFTTYSIPVAADKLVVGGGVVYRSKNYSDTQNPVTDDPFRLQQDGYTLVNLMARYELGNNLQFQANIENIFDKTYYTQIGFFSQYRYGEPRNFTLGGTYRF